MEERGYISGGSGSGAHIEGVYWVVKGIKKRGASLTCITGYSHYWHVVGLCVVGNIANKYASNEKGP